MRYWLILILVMSVPSVNAEPEVTLKYLLPTGDMNQQTQALFVKESLGQIGINVELDYVSPSLFEDYVNGGGFARSVASHDLLMYPVSPWSDYFNQFDDGRIQMLPDFSWNYDFTEYSNPSLYKLGSNQPVFGSHTAMEFIEMLQVLNRQGSMDDYRSKLLEFMQYFMGELLFDIPMFRETEPVSIQNGFGDELSFNWDPNRSVLDHLMRGFRWERPNSTHTTIPGVVDDFLDTLEYVQDPLVYFDEEFNPHPAISYQYVSGDFGEVITFDGVPNRVARHTFFIPEDRYWSTGEVVTANDFVLGLQYNPYNQHLPEYLTYEIDTTISTNDSLSIFVDVGKMNTWDFYDLGNLKPIPTHIFGDGLQNFFGETSKMLESDEWQEFLDNPSLVGPFEIVGQTSLRMRDDYYFPTEDDMANYYGMEFLDMEILTNLNFSDFAPHTQTFPLYWQDQDILTIDIIDGDLTAFLSGDMDIINQEVEGFVSRERYTRSFPNLLVFNLGNTYLQDFRVRKAIAHALDREELRKIYPSMELSTSMLAGPSYFFEEDLAIPYSMNAAKVILNGGGLFHADTRTPEISDENEVSLIFNIFLVIFPILLKKYRIKSE
ncbi:MAG: hypothetical protein GPJ54_20850 [Candidatus Heimdallarchaeota archaeon]|nr:hypothetical protein [Candidatus Heimdallarchaeota archaeon]